MNETRHLTTYAAMKLLAEAGDQGLTTTGIAVQFTVPETHQQRSNRVSQIMRAMLDKGYVRQGRAEPTTFHEPGKQAGGGSPVRRWHITTSGSDEYLTSTAREMRDRSRAERAAELQRQFAEAEKRRTDALAAARRELARHLRESTMTKCWRYRKVIELRQAYCSLQQIGEVFGITRERVRQIEAGREEPCSCEGCQVTPSIS